MARTLTLRARPLHAQARQVVLERILRGEFRPGTRLVEGLIAQELGVSRTPLREALMHLEREGFLELQPNRGFFVAGLSPGEARELYPILALLESHALELTGPPEDSRVTQLSELNERLLAHESAPQEAFSVNVEWHTVLTSGCPNRLLLKMLASVRRKVYRYEWAYFAPGGDRVRNSVEHHDSILSTLESGDMAAAVQALGSHWSSDLNALLAAMPETN
jgi:DNA-binding GntR family transcriptional regulator